MKHVELQVLVALIVTSGCSGQIMVDSGQSSELVLECGRSSPYLPVGEGWSTNPPECPATAPAVPGACAGPEGLTCAYLGEDERRVHPALGILSPRYTECGCFADGADGLRWFCFQESDQYSGADTYDRCPATAPVHGESCAGYAAQTCPVVPKGDCECDLSAEVGSAGQGPIWICSNVLDAFPVAPELPQTLDETRPVNELSQSEREAWCQWFQSVPWDVDNPSPPSREGTVSKDGMASYTQCGLGYDFVCNGALPALSQTHCEQNLALSECDAPLSELTDCVKTMIHWCTPEPRGCGPYLERPGCYGTIVAPPLCDETLAATGTCSVRVE